MTGVEITAAVSSTAFIVALWALAARVRRDDAAAKRAAMDEARAIAERLRGPEFDANASATRGPDGKWKPYVAITRRDRVDAE